MGMSFYASNGKHIGKVSFAGFWCWACKSRIIVEKGYFICPKCRKKEKDWVVEGRQEGYMEGIQSEIARAYSFTWQVGSLGLGDTIEEVKKNLKRRKRIKTEYGEVWDMDKFWGKFKSVLEENSLAQRFF